MHFPLFNVERILNKGVYLLSLAKTSILLLRLISCFRDNNVVYLVIEYINGVGMNDLNDKSRAVVVEEL